MRAFLLNCLLILLLTPLLPAQESGTKLGVSLLPELSKAFIVRGESSNSLHARLSTAGKFGLYIKQPLTSKFYLRTGLFYSLERYNVDAYNIYLESNNFAIETEIKEEVQLGSLLIPLQFHYAINDDWAIFTGLGIQLPFYTERYRYIINGGEEKKSLYEVDLDIQKGWWAFSFGISRTIAKNFIHLDISPQLWFHTHRSQIPLGAYSTVQMTTGIEFTAWLF